MIRHPARRIQHVLAVLAAPIVALSVSITLAGPASAADLEYQTATEVANWNCSGPDVILTLYGGTCIDANDNPRLQDTGDDSKSVGVHWKFRNDDRRGLCQLTAGPQTAGICYHNFPDGIIVDFRLGRCSSECRQISSYNWTTWEDMRTAG